MAVVKGLLTEAMILGLKGEIDFYYHRGQVVARSWPKKRTIPATVAEQSNQTFFGKVQTKIKNMSEPNRAQWRAFTRGTNIIWTDAVRFSNLTGNPDQIILPNVYALRWTAEIRDYPANPPYDKNYYLKVFYKKDGWTGDATELFGVHLILSETPIAPITWQAVGQKRRRRAILSEQFRPQSSGYNHQSSCEQSADPSEMYASIDEWYKYNSVLVVLDVWEHDAPALLQSPILRIDIPSWPSAGSLIDWTP